MKLICDIRCGCDTKRIYGHMGDEVKVIVDHGHVCIVEDEDGNRFPVLTEFLTTEKIIPKPAAPSTAATASNQSIINKRVPVQKKAAPINQPNLF